MRMGPDRIVQIVFGIVLIVFFLMPVFGWEPPPVSAGAQPMQQAISSSGYVMPVILTVYLLVGLSWLFGYFVALSAVVLFPITLNIVLFHAVLNRTPFGLVAGSLFLVVNLCVLYQMRESYARLLHPNS